jgi:hypothetical protein
VHGDFCCVDYGVASFSSWSNLTFKFLEHIVVSLHHQKSFLELKFFNIFGRKKCVANDFKIRSIR